MTPTEAQKREREDDAADCGCEFECHFGRLTCDSCGGDFCVCACGGDGGDCLGCDECPDDAWGDEFDGNPLPDEEG